MAPLLQKYQRCLDDDKKRGHLPKFCKGYKLFCMNYSRRHPMKIRPFHFILPAALMFTAACSTVQPPTTLLTQAQERVRQAESVGAEESAPLVLRDAQQYLNEAEKSMQKERFDEAQQLLEKSMISSELAIARTGSSKAQKAAEEIEKNLDLLRREAGPDTSSPVSSYE